MTKINRRIEDAEFLWNNGRQESAFILLLVSIASISKVRYPNKSDRDAFEKLLKDFNTISLSVEYNGKLETIEHILYKHIRCNLIHEGGLPSDIEFQEEQKFGLMSVRAGGAPDYILKIGAGWFYHLLDSVKQSNEIYGI